MIDIGNIEATGLWVGNKKADAAYVGIVKVWGQSAPLGDCLCFTAEEANSTVRLDKVGSPNAISLETSTDKSTWTDYTWSGDTGATLTLANVGDKVYMRAKTTNQAIGSSVVNYHKFVMTGKIAASGNVDTLLDQNGNATLTSYCYAYLFYGCSSLTSTPTLPATSLASDCYYGMFENCTSLTTAPELPATTLANYCYRNMFRSCSSLTSAPELRATTLADYCYANTFNGCTSLTTAPELPATTLATNCYLGMFNGCSNLNTITLGYTGTFADAPSGAFTNWVSGVAASGTFYYDGTDTTTGVSAIPVGWTVLPIPIPTKVKYTAESGLSDWESDIVGNLHGSIRINWTRPVVNHTTRIENVTSAEQVDVGTNVTKISQAAFASCISLSSVVVPSATDVDADAFFGNSKLSSLTMTGRTTTDVQNMSGWPSQTMSYPGGTLTMEKFSLPTGCVIHCTDGDITI